MGCGTRGNRNTDRRYGFGARTWPWGQVLILCYDGQGELRNAERRNGGLGYGVDRNARARYEVLKVFGQVVAGDTLAKGFL